MSYTNITKEEMTKFLVSQGFMSMDLPKISEIVFGKRVDKNGMQLSLRVYTGITGQNSRDCGKDAIRVNLFYRNKKNGKVVKVGSFKRVNRIHTWRKNLQSRLDNWEKNCPIGFCPKCKMPLVKRKGKNGEFLGCSSYPECKYTKEMSHDSIKQ